jgi:hypothetical protein
MYDTLAEVLQQRVRLDDPHALRRKQFDRRVKGEAPPLSDAEMLRARWVGAWAPVVAAGTAADSNALEPSLHMFCPLLFLPPACPAGARCML